MNRTSDTQSRAASGRLFLIVWKGMFLGLMSLGTPNNAQAQESISLDQCLVWVEENYPLARQTVLVNEQAKLDVQALEKGRLPQIDLNGQATYQSEVTRIPGQLPNISIDPPNKDQYRTTLDASQLLYHGGMIDALVKARTTQSAIEKQEVEVTLYGLKNRINTLYFSLLLLQEHQALLEAKRNQLQTQLREVNAGVKYGTLLPASADALDVELIKIEQGQAELNVSKSDLRHQLSLMIGKELDGAVMLLRPEILDSTSGQLSARPELTLFELQKSHLDLSTELLAKSKLPKISAFAQGGYGNPGLNMLDNSFNSFFMTGVKLNWKVFDWNKNRKEQQALQVQKERIDTQKEAFELTTEMELANLKAEIDKMEELIRYDLAIIPRYETIVKSAESQLRNGVITSSAYVIEFTKLYEAKQNLTLHQTQKLLNQIQYQITQGTYENSSN